MTKHVRFDSNVQIREMSIDKLAHSVDVKTARDIIVSPVPSTSVPSLISLIIWLIIILVALYLIYRLTK